MRTMILLVALGAGACGAHHDPPAPSSTTTQRDSPDDSSGDDSSGDDDSSASADGNCTISTYQFVRQGSTASCSYNVSSPNPCCGVSSDPVGTCPSSGGWNWVGGTRQHLDASCNVSSTEDL